MGVIIYECMNGRRPYIGKGRKEIREQILARQVQIKRYEIPDGWSLESADFINKVSKTITLLKINFLAIVKKTIKQTWPQWES
jgi:hypothetical protein